MKRLLFLILILILAVFLLGGVVKGTKDGNILKYQANYDTSVGGPFESSGSDSRYALVEAIAKDHTFFLNQDLAKLSSPDLVLYQGHSLSIFTPGIAFIGVPFYILGMIFGLPQLVTYLSVTVFALLNIFLIAKVAIELGVNKYAGYLSGLVFAFATNALSYGTTLTQHETSASVILLAILNAVGERTLLKNVIFGSLVGIGALVDIPNLFFLAPIGIYIIAKHFQKNKVSDKIQLSIKTSIIGLLIGLIPFLGLFAYYNHQTTGSYTKVSQFIGRAPSSNSVPPAQASTENSTEIILLNTPFQTRSELTSLYTLLLSNERSWIFYSPIVLVGIIGLYLAFKEKRRSDLATLIIAVVLVNIFLYAMFSDPWGGWAFGPRYLIPAAALLCSALGITIQKYKNNLIFVTAFLLILVYSIAVNSLGAITAQSIPPKVEAIHLSKPIPYTYEYNYQLLNQGESSSLIYNSWLKKYMNSFQFWIVYSLLIFLPLSSLYLLVLISKDRPEE